MKRQKSKLKSYKILLLKTLEYLDDYDPQNHLAMGILASLAYHDDLEGVSDRYTAVGFLPKLIRDKIIASADAQGQAIIIAKKEPISDEVWTERCTQWRK